MTEFIRRTKEESPFYLAGVRNQWPTAEVYGKKVDRFCLEGTGTVTRYAQTGPFTEGYETNAYATLPRSTHSGMPPSDSGGEGRSATPRAWLYGEDREVLTNT